MDVIILLKLRGKEQKKGNILDIIILLASKCIKKSDMKDKITNRNKNKKDNKNRKKLIVIKIIMI